MNVMLNPDLVWCDFDFSVGQHPAMKLGTKFANGEATQHFIHCDSFREF
jgi:hypothetical protein